MRSFDRTQHHRHRRTSALVGVVAALAVLTTAGCGSDAPSGSAPDTTLAPVGSVDPNTDTKTDTAVDATAPVGSDSTGATDDGSPSGAAPERVVSLSATHTEIMFAIGAGDQLVAVDDNSNYPAEALELPHELSSFEPNVEAIAAYEPDLVLIGGDSTELGAQLDELGIAWWDGPAAVTLADTYTQIEQLGAATDHIAEAAELVGRMQTDIDEIVANAPTVETPLSIYHELDPTLYSADSTTFIGELYGLLGLRNIADEAEGDSGGYPQLNAEFIVSADPDMIFLADTKCCDETAATVGARPGWDAISAVQNGNVVEMDDDIASRWGPRVVDYLAAVAAAVEKAAVPA
jgi:iron complex transport system substrate-binding protein